MDNRLLTIQLKAGIMKKSKTYSLKFVLPDIYLIPIIYLEVPKLSRGSIEAHTLDTYTVALHQILNYKYG